MQVHDEMGVAQIFGYVEQNMIWEIRPQEILKKCNFQSCFTDW